MKKNIQLNAARLMVILAITIGSSLAFGYSKDQPRGAKFFKEQSEDQLKSQQQYQGTIGVVGSVEEKTEPVQPQGSLGEESDRGSFANVNATKAKESFASANQQIKEIKNQLNPWFLLCMLLGVLGLAATGLKAYSDKVVPLPKSLQ